MPGLITPGQGRQGGEQLYDYLFCMSRFYISLFLCLSRWISAFAVLLFGIAFCYTFSCVVCVLVYFIWFECGWVRLGLVGSMGEGEGGSCGSRMVSCEGREGSIVHSPDTCIYTYIRDGK